MEFLTENRGNGGGRITICCPLLQPRAEAISFARTMGRWRTTMRELSAEARLHFHARSLSRRSGSGLHLVALCSAFAVIAAIVFGTLSMHPF